MLLSSTVALSAESAHGVYVRALSNFGQYRQNMNGRWFAVQAVRTYSGTKESSDKHQIRGMYGLVFYSESLMYITMQQRLSTTVNSQPLGQHFEALLTENWCLSIDHGEPLATLKVVQNSGQGLPSADYRVHEVDILMKFEWHAEKKARHEFARPRLDLDNRLIVSLDTEVYVRDLTQDRQNQHPKQEVIFAEEPLLRPAFVRSFEIDSAGRRKQLALTDIRYTENSDGQPILQRILTESNTPGRSPTVFDLIVCETSRPEWCEDQLTVSLPIGAVAMMQGQAGQKRTTSELPTDISHLIRQLGDSEWKHYLGAQRKTLESVRDFVAMTAISPPETDLPTLEASESDQPPKSSFERILLASVGLALVGCCLMFWRKAHFGRGESEA